MQQKSKMLEISFDDGKRFELPCEYLRVYSPSAEVRGHGPGQEKLQYGKQNVSIDRIEPQGAYAVRLCFDDGHDTGIYSWDMLYDLGIHHDEFWNDYLQRLVESGYERKPSSSGIPVVIKTPTSREE